MPQGFVVDRFPVEVKKQVDYFVSVGLSPRSIHEWLEANVYPAWRREGRNDLCVTRKTMYNYMKKHCPENLVVFKSYVEGAMGRVSEDVDAMAAIRGNISTLESLIKQFDLSGKLNLREIGEIRRLLHELVEANRKYLELEIRLGLKEAKTLEESEESVLDRLRREQEEREKKALERVVEP